MLAYSSQISKKNSEEEKMSSFNGFVVFSERARGREVDEQTRIQENIAQRRLECQQIESGMNTMIEDLAELHARDGDWPERAHQRAYANLKALMANYCTDCGAFWPKEGDHKAPLKLRADGITLCIHTNVTCTCCRTKLYGLTGLLFPTHEFDVNCCPVCAGIRPKR